MSTNSDVAKNLAALNASSAIETQTAGMQGKINTYNQNIDRTIANIGSITGATTPANILAFTRLANKKLSELKAKQKDITGFSPNFLSSASNTQSQAAIRDLIAQQGVRVLDAFNATGTAVGNAGKAASNNLYTISQNIANQTNKTGVDTFNNVSGLGANQIQSLTATGSQGTQRMANAALTPFASIANMQNNPAFSALLNPVFTRLAYNPPPLPKATGLEKLYSYNV